MSSIWFDIRGNTKCLWYTTTKLIKFWYCNDIGYTSRLCTQLNVKLGNIALQLKFVYV